MTEQPVDLKERNRACEKILWDYSGDSSRILDVTRSTILYETLGDALKALPIAGNDMEVVGEKDRLSNPLAIGYRDALLHVRLPNGHIGEIQIQIKPLRNIKEQEQANWEEIRKIRTAAKKEDRPLRPDEAVLISGLTHQAKQRYESECPVSSPQMRLRR